MAILPVLKRFDTFVYKPTSLGNTVIIPAAGATLRFYAQGATVSADQDIPSNSSPFTVQFYHPGELKVGDHLYLENNLPANSLLRLDAIDLQSSQLTLVNLQPTIPSAAAAPRKRLVDITQLLQIYADPLGVQPPASLLTADASGRASGYIRNLRFDYTVEFAPDSPYNPLVYHDAEGSFVMRC